MTFALFIICTVLYRYLVRTGYQVPGTVPGTRTAVFQQGSRIIFALSSRAERRSSARRSARLGYDVSGVCHHSFFIPQRSYRYNPVCTGTRYCTTGAGRRIYEVHTGTGTGTYVPARVSAWYRSVAGVQKLTRARRILVPVSTGGMSSLISSLARSNQPLGRDLLEAGSALNRGMTYWTHTLTFFASSP